MNWIRVLAVILAVVVLLLGLIWLLQRKLIYLPDSSPVPPAAEILPGAQDVPLHTSDGLTLGAWFIPPTGSAPVVLVAPGNAGNRAGRAPLATALAARGMGVLLVDYRGYGANPGSPDEDGLRQDIRAAHRFLTQQRHTQLIYYGESLGSAVVTDLAAEHPPAALVLRSPFTDLAAAGAEHYPLLPVRLLLRDRFPLADTISRVHAPVTVVLGTADTVIPPEQSREVARAANATLIEIPGADHNDRALLDGQPLIDAITTALG